MTACPHRGDAIGQDGADAVFAADQAAAGVWPASGGWMEQANTAVLAVRRVWQEEAYWRRQQEQG